MTLLTRRNSLALGGSALLLPASLARAQATWPAGPVTFVVGYAAGGGNDIIVRVMQPEMTKGLGQPVVVENKPGAQSIIAAETVAKSAPDGYTILMGPSGPMTINPAVYSKLPYDPMRDFAPVSLLAEFPLLLVVGLLIGRNRGAYRIQAECYANRANGLPCPQAHVDAQPQGADARQRSRGSVTSDPVATVPCQECPERGLVHARDFQIQVRQVAATLVHEQLRIQAIVERTELGLHQPQRPCDEAVTRRPADSEWNTVLFAKLADVVRHQQ